MNWIDYTNGIFELVGGLILLLNVRQLFKDKKVSGVCVLPTVFFCAWGYWNLVFYSSLGQWASLAGSISVVICNTIWVILALYYRSGRCRHVKRG